MRFRTCIDRIEYVRLPITSQISRVEFGALGHLPRHIFAQTAHERFSRLDRDYIAKKYSEEKFPVQGNALLAQAIGRLMASQPSHWQSKSSILITDIGPAGGALTSLFMLAELHRLGLLAKARIQLVDMSEAALQSTRRGKCPLPSTLLSDFGYFVPIRLLQRTLSHASLQVRDALDLGGLPVSDIVVSGFTHHHLNLADKPLAVAEMERIASAGAIVGVVDECMDYMDYLGWVRAHENETNSRGERVPIAVESFISVEAHIRLLRQSAIIESGSFRHGYYFTALRSVSLEPNA